MLEFYNFVLSVDLVKYLCCDVCDMYCDCYEVNCEFFRIMYYIYKFELDIESLSEFSMFSDNYSIDILKIISEFESD